MPMFPLNSVLFPFQALPLHVFEERYRALARRCVEGDGRFGVVLIERGHEVGGGEVRVDVGTVAEILRARELEDGRWLIEAVGTDRLRVEAWLPDDPHPLAEVTLAGDDPDARSVEIDRVTNRLRRLLALRAELGRPSPPSTLEFDGDPTIVSWQIAILAGLNPLDGLRVLDIDGLGDRLDLLGELLDDQITLAEAMLSE